jgi:uncharacterized repeat protein (TIGR01451 family)
MTRLNLKSFIKKGKQCLLVIALFTVSIGYSGFQNILVSAAVPEVQTTIRVLADGSSPFDPNTYDIATNTNGGNDAGDANGIVRVQDFITYRIEANLNNKADTNLVSRIVLDTNQEWTAVPTSCSKTNVTPISTIEDFDPISPGDDKRVLICNFGDSKEGIQYAVNAVAVVKGNSTNAFVADQTNCNSLQRPVAPTLNPTAPTLDTTSGCTSAYIYTKSDNSAPADYEPVRTLVTSGFRIDLSKVLPSRPGSPSDYKPIQNRPNQAPNTSQLGNVLEYTITGTAAAGSEAVKSTGGLANFTLSDCYVDNNSVNGNNSTDSNCTIPGWINSSGMKLYNWDTSLPAAAQDGCVAFSNEVTDTNLICTQPGGPGTEIKIQLNNVDVTYPIKQGQLFSFKVRVWIPINADINSDLANCVSPGNCTLQTINTIKFAKFNPNPGVPASEINGEPISETNLNNYNGAGEPQTNNSFLYPLATQTPGSDVFRKYFDSVTITSPNENLPYGQLNVTQNSIIPVTLRVTNFVNNYGSGIRRTYCEKIDTSNFEFDSVPASGYNQAYAPGHFLHNNLKRFNPVITTKFLGTLPADFAKDDAVIFSGFATQNAFVVEPGIRIEYGSDPTYSTTPSALRSDNCPNDLDGDVSTNDWFTNPNSVPGGASTINKIRIIVDNINLVNSLNNYYGRVDADRSILMLNYLVKVKGTNPYPVTIGTKNYNFLPNYTHTSYFNYSTGNTNTQIPPASTATVSPTNVSFSYSAPNFNADRVNLINAKYNIEKRVLNKYVYDAGDEIEYEIIPTLEGAVSGPINFTITDTLPNSNFKIVPGSFLPDPNCTTNGNYIFPTSQTGNNFSVDLNNATTNSPLCKFTFRVKINQETPAGDYINTVRITANNPTNLPQITALNSDSEVCGGGSQQPAGNFLCSSFLSPVSAVSIQILSQNSYSIFKTIPKTTYEVNKDIDYNVVYSRSGSENYGPGDFIDILPFNGDNDDTIPSNFTSDRINTFTNTGTGSSYSEGTADLLPGLATAPIGTNGEVFTFTNANPATIKTDPCHSTNQPSGYVPISGDVCYLQYILNGNKFVDGATTGSGLVKWCDFSQFGTAGCPTNYENVSAVRWTSTPHISTDSASRSIQLKIKPRGNKENDVYCNSSFGRVPNISLEIISNDVCAKVFSGNISGTIWLDKTTTNGTLEATDTRLSGIQIGLFDTAGNPILDPVTGLAVTVNTDSNGFYEFKELTSGTYLTKVISGIDSNYIQSYDLDDGAVAPNYTTSNSSGIFTISPVTIPNPDPNDSLANPTILSDINDRQQVNFGYSANLSIGNSVWFDTNNNGSVDSNELGINGVLVYLFQEGADTDNSGSLSATEIAAATPYSTTTTANDTRIGSTNGQPGYYQFDSLATGKYFVYLPPSNFQSGQVLEELDLSPVPAGVGDTQDDKKNHGTLPIGGTSLGVNGAVSTIIDLSPGSEPTTTSAKTDDDTSSNTDTTIDFGFYHSYSLGNRIWFDYDNNGIINGLETGVPNTFVNLINPNTNAIIGTTTTDSNGYYRFDNLQAGDYIVQVPPTEFIVGKPLHRHIATSNGLELNPNSDVDSNNNASTGSALIGFRTGIISLGPLASETTGETDLVSGPNNQGNSDKFANMTLDLGFIPPAHIGDTVYFDLNGNGIQDGNEPGINGVEVFLVEAGPDGIFDTPDDVTIPSQFTNINGKYDFPNLTPGRYRTTVNTSSLASSNLTTPSTYTVNLGVNQDDFTHDYGFNSTGEFGDSVWIDANNDGIKDTSETGIANVQIELYFDINGDGIIDNDDTLVGSQTTDSNGNYKFNNLLLEDNISVNGPGAKYIAKVIQSTLPPGTITSILGLPNTNNQNQNADGFEFTLDPANPTNENGDFGYILEPRISIDKTLYENHNSGANCPGVNELILVDKNKALKNITYCFTVTNNGGTYLNNIVINDPLLSINQTQMTLLNGVFPLAPNTSATWYFETQKNDSSTNTADTRANPVFANGTPTGQGDPTDDDPAGARLIYVFDPPFGIKTGEVIENQNVIRWTMQWINNSTITANNVLITDEIPAGTIFRGNLQCNAQGISVILSCEYQAPNAEYPRGAVIATANIGPDPGAQISAQAANEVDIIFDVSIPSQAGEISNQARLRWDADGDGNYDIDELSKSPSGSGPTTVNITKVSILAATGINILRITLISASITFIIYIINRPKKTSKK